MKPWSARCKAAWASPAACWWSMAQRCLPSVVWFLPGWAGYLRLAARQTAPPRCRTCRRRSEWSRRFAALSGDVGLSTRSRCRRLASKPPGRRADGAGRRRDVQTRGYQRAGAGLPARGAYRRPKGRSWTMRWQEILANFQRAPVDLGTSILAIVRRIARWSRTPQRRDPRYGRRRRITVPSAIMLVPLLAAGSEVGRQVWRKEDPAVVRRVTLLLT